MTRTETNFQHSFFTNKKKRLGRKDGRFALQRFIIRADIGVGAVFETEALGDNAELLKAQTLIQVPGMNVRGDDGVELHDPEAEIFGGLETVEHKLLSDMQASCLA